MTWSSSRPDTSASDFDWADLGGPTKEDAAEQEALFAEAHRLEVEKAYRRGASDGQVAASKAARAELATAVTAAIQALEEVRAHREAWATSLQEDLVLLAAAMARLIVDRALDEDPSIFSDLAKRAVASVPADEGVRIRLHPDDLARITDAAQVDEIVGGRTVRWVPDEDVVCGGCIVEGPDRIVDGRVDEALRRLIRRLSDAA